MIDRFSCFSSPCKKPVEFICNCTVPETMMCRDHINKHLISLNTHKIANLISEKDHIIKTFNLEKCLLIEIKNTLNVSFGQSFKELLRLKLLEIEESINIIEKIIQDYKRRNIFINSRGSALKIIEKEVNKNKNYLADLILKEKNTQIDAFIKKLGSLKDISEHRQLKAELIEISTFDKYDNYIFLLAQENIDINSKRNKFTKKCKNLQVLFEESIFKLDKYSFSFALRDILSNTFQCNLVKKYEKIPKSFRNSILKTHDKTYKHCNIDFNYLYNYDENLNGTEIYIYDIESGLRTSSVITKSYQNCPYRLLDKITNNKNFKLTFTYSRKSH
ncbi:unnamed protein product [Blepharisma stoltei]|uniref:Uncharacterized protein n=1 Tax=Blepharisma stoltei TaxID=1481888 RepID=A0AAU9JDJ4_9CILI|nr:unnamed protein product [Blepharisma stoltei]